MRLPNMAIHSKRHRIDQPHRTDLRRRDLARGDQRTNALKVHPEQGSSVSHDQVILDDTHGLTLL
jgi:hypothetical protein